MHPVCVYDFTLRSQDVDHEKLQEYLKDGCKTWVFQEELSDTGYLHYQGRISLKVKGRLPQAKAVFKDYTSVHLSPTSLQNMGNDFYVTKLDTRTRGPWKDTDENAPYIPRQIRDIKSLWPWQQTVVDSANTWDTRSVNVILDTAGHTGKSTLATYIGVYKIGRQLPPFNDHKDLMRVVMDVPTSKLYMFDLPRAMNKDRLHSLYAAIETIKNGYAYDDRYSFREKYFDCPTIWVFSNFLPDSNHLTTDRWKYWKIVNSTLVPLPRLELAVASEASQGGVGGDGAPPPEADCKGKRKINEVD